jgi:hypothetical protein
MSNPNLTDTQRLLWKLITAPEGVEKGLAELPPAERELARGLVRERRPLSAVERWDIYANMYFYRIRDCLREEFGAIAGVIGDINFHNLVTDYLLAHPPSHFSLRYVGQHLSDFLDMHALRVRWPYLSDLARLEHAVTDAFDAPDAAPLRAEDLTAIDPADWPALRFAVTPSLRLLRLDWPIGAVWSAVKGGAEAPAVDAKATTIRVWRRDLRVFHKTIDSREAAALAALQAGSAFERVCEILANDGCQEEGAEVAFGMLRSWLADEVLCTHRE